jgi:phage tail-like protein
MLDIFQSNETITTPFSTFNFQVEINLEGDPDTLCSAAFSECSGLDMTMEPKTIKEGGNNNQTIHLVGPVRYGQLTLKRGMTSTFDLWDWFERVVAPGGGNVRANCVVVMLAPDGKTEQVHFELSNCLPVKMSAPSLNAKDGQLAIEEVQIVYERLRLRPPGAAGAGLSLGVSAGLSAGAKVSAGASAQVTASANVNFGL